MFVDINLDFILKLYYNKLEKSVVITTKIKKEEIFLPIEKYLPLLRKTRLFNKIDDKDIIYICNRLNGKIKKCSADDSVYSYGDRITSLHMLLEGDVFLMREDVWGHSNILVKIEPGECFGVTHTFMEDNIVTYHALSKHGCVYLILDKELIMSPFKQNYPVQEQIIRNVMSILVNRNLYLSVKIEHISQRKTRDKIISYLSFESQRQKTDDFHIPFTRSQLAAYLCVDRSALSNELCKLRDEGLIKFDRNHFILKNADNF